MTWDETCRHEESLHGRCTRCGRTWDEQAEDRRIRATNADVALVESNLDDPAPMELSIRELRFLHRGLKAYRKKLERQLANRPFTPEAGHLNVTGLNHSNALHLEHRLLAELNQRFRDLREQDRLEPGKAYRVD